MNGNLLKNSTGYAAAFGAADITSERMRKAIQLWFSLYYHNEPTEKEDPCQQIPYTVVRKLTKTVFSEYTTTTKDEFARQVLKELTNVSGEVMQSALIGGEALIKPVIQPKKGIVFAVVPRNNLLVFARDARGNMTDIGTLEVTTGGNRYYTLLERRTVDDGGYLTIRYKLFESYTNETLGQQVSLAKLPQYAQMKETYTFAKPVGSIGLVRVKMPMVNSVDGSPDGVSVYAAATGLIQNINRNEAQLNGEFKRGESRIIVSSDMLARKNDGSADLQDNLFVGLDEDPETTGIKIFSPTLREASFLARKHEYLRNVENVIGLKRGLLSEVEAAERTATEITSSAGEYNLTVLDLQKMWQTATLDTLRLCGLLGELYKIDGAHVVADDAVVIDFGNGILYDEYKTRQEMLSQVQAGLLQPERYLGHCYNQPCDTAKQREKIRRDYMPVSADLLDGVTE